MNIVSCVRRPDELKIYEVKPHQHPHWEITLNLEGEFCTNLGGQTYRLLPGDITVIPPGVSHQGTSQEGFRDIFLQAKKIDFFDVAVVRDTEGAVYQLMHLLHRVAVEGDDGGRLADSLVESICHYIKHYAKTEHGHPAVQTLKKTIYEHLSDAEFEVTQGIEQTGFDKDYLRRCFKREVGKTPLEYLTSLRMEQAKMLLIQQTFSGVESVALSCGFADPFYFSTCFKKHVGVSPLQYRKQNVT
ncbi:MAG: helix-turn-helix domain-containing protein [Clostridia bacterium]|nr:helix-turn-helix domain-containing protein [Clostridia bacterium]